MILQQLKFHDKKIKTIKINENILTSNSKNKVISYNLCENKILKIIHIDNEQYIENNNYIYSINNGNTISKTNGVIHKKIAFLGSRITYIINHNSDIYFGVEDGFIYLFKNKQITKIITHLNFKLTCFYIDDSYIYIGYNNGTIGIFYNNKKYKIVKPHGYFGKVISIIKHGEYIYCTYDKGAIKILYNNICTKTINLFSEKTIIHKQDNNIYLYANSSIIKLKDNYTKKIFQTNDNVCDFVYNNNLMFTSDGNNIKIYLIKLTGNNYNSVPDNVKKYIFRVYMYCNINLVTDLFFKIINLILYTKNVTHL